VGVGVVRKLRRRCYLRDDEWAAKHADMATARYAGRQGLSLESVPVRRFWEALFRQTIFDRDAQLVLRGSLALSSYELMEGLALSRRLSAIGRKNRSSPAKQMRAVAKDAIRWGMKPIVAKAILEHAQKWYGLSEVE